MEWTARLSLVVRFGPAVVARPTRRGRLWRRRWGTPRPCMARVSATDALPQHGVGRSHWTPEAGDARAQVRATGLTAGDGPGSEAQAASGQEGRVNAPCALTRLSPLFQQLICGYSCHRGLSLTPFESKPPFPSISKGAQIRHILQSKPLQTPFRVDRPEQVGRGMSMESPHFQGVSSFAATLVTEGFR